MVGVQWRALELKALDFPYFAAIVLVFTVPHPSHSGLKNATALPQYV
jgi:hypothetical protein